MTDSTEQADLTLAAGTLVNGYRIERELGRGAMSVVYLAQQLDLQRPVALKVLAADLAADKEYVTRFFNEARAAAALSHPNIIQAYDAGVAEGDLYYFCMEFVEGETLLERIEREERLPLDESLKIAREIADALNFGYQRYKFTHGDIKPDNIMVNRQGQAKLADFGLAKVEGHDYDGSEVMLTPLYAPPELIRGERRPGDCRGDIYAFGATLYHIIAGSPPFPGTNAHSVMDRHLHENPEPLRLRYPKTPLGLSDLVSRMLAKDPERRPQNWEEVLNGLRQCQLYLANLASAGSPNHVKKPLIFKQNPATEGSAAPPQPTFPARGIGKTRSLTWMLVSIILACGLALAALAAVVTKSQRKTDAPPPAVIQLVPPSEQPPNGTSIAGAAQHDDDAAEPDDGNAPADNATPEMADEPTPNPPPTDQQVTKTEPFDEAAPTDTTDSQPPQPQPPAFQLRPPMTAIALPRYQHQRDQEIWIEAAQCLGRLQYDLSQNTPVEPMMQAVQEWLSSRQQDSEAVVFMHFIHDVALPALEELKVKLVQNKDTLIGASMQTRRKRTVVIHDITFVSIEVDAALAGDRGRYRQSLRWNQARSEGIVEELCRLLYLRPEASLADLRPLLGYLAFTGRSQEINRLLRAQPESLERRHWEMLPKMEAWAGKTEADGLKTWQRLQQACLDGSPTAAYSLASRLRKSNATIAGLYREQLDDLINRCRPAVPEQQGGEQLRQAQTAIQLGRHTDALAPLLLAQARFGMADFPEKSDLTRRLRALQAKLPAEDWLDETKQLTLSDLTPFVFRRRPAPWPAWTAIACREAATSGERRLRENPGLSQMTEWSQLEMGDWAGPLAKLEKKQLSISGLEDPIQKLAALYGAGLLQERFGANLRQAENTLAQLASTAKQIGNAHSLEAMALPVRYALLTRLSGRRQPQDYVLLTPDSIPPGNTNAVQTFLLLTLTTFHEADAQDAIKALRQALGTETKTVVNQNSRALQQLSAALQKLDKPRREVNIMSSPPGGKLSIAWLRLRLACAGQARLASAGDQPFMELVEAEAAGWPLDGGELVYTWLLRRCADLIACGDLEGACQKVEWCLSLPYSCLFPYYTRFHFLKAGLCLLGGSRGALETAVVCANAATVASEAEKSFLAAVSKRDSSDSALARLPADHPAQYWCHWLAVCLASADPPGNVDSRLTAMAPHALTLAEKRLHNGLSAFLRATNANPPQPK